MNSSYDLSLEEQKIILTLASMVQPTDEEFKQYKFKISDFIKMLGLSTQTKYTEIPKITKELMKKVFEIEEGKKIIQVAWLSSTVYEKGTGYVELEISPRLKPYMLKLGTLFTQYKLANILSMKSKYSPRVYEILKANEFKTQKYIEIEIDELRKILKSEKIYPLYADFKRKIIIQSQREINQKTDISFEFEEVKTGRKVTSLKFYIKSKSKDNKEIALTVEADPVIEEVRNIMFAHEFSDKEIRSILKSAKGDLERIKEVYKHFKNNKATNFVGLMISMVDSKDGFDKSQHDNSTDNNSDHGYDLDDIENKLNENAWK